MSKLRFQTLVDPLFAQLLTDAASVISGTILWRFCSIPHMIVYCLFRDVSGGALFWKLLRFSIPLFDFLSDLNCFVQLNTASTKIRLAAYSWRSKVKSPLWYSSEAHCGTSSGITSTDLSGHGQLWQPRCSRNAMQPYTAKSAGYDVFQS